MGLRWKKERDTKMTVSELKGILEDYATDGTGDLKVRIAEQPTWPLASDVSAVSRIGDTVWIADSRTADYAPKAAWDSVDIDEDEDEDEE